MKKKTDYRIGCHCFYNSRCLSDKCYCKKFKKEWDENQKRETEFEKAKIISINNSHSIINK